MIYRIVIVKVYSFWEIKSPEIDYSIDMPQHLNRMVSWFENRIKAVVDIR